MRTVIGLVLSASTALAQPTSPVTLPAPTAPADAEPAPGVEPTVPAESPAPPQVTARPARSIGIDAAIVLPMSDYADDAKIGFGAFARAELPRSELFAFTLRGGALLHVPAENRDALLLVPLLAGVQFAFAKPRFVAVDAGLMFRYAGEAAAAAGLAFGGGYRSGRISARAEFLVPDLGAADSTAGVLASFGFSL
ncbi:MAG: hypothetical protein H0V17_14430 [Deltaproteobacteria bacterium]|nr:hypothetical protein [Deltaproteobacteria bacterium]